MLIVKTANPNDYKLKKQAKEYYKDSPLMQDKILVYGGDGTLLRTIHEVGLNRVFVPFNAGTLGFLMNPRTEEAAVKFAEGKFTIYEFNLLEIKAYYRDDVDHLTTFAVNDVYIERDSGQTARLELEVDNNPLMSSGDFLGADGIIISTSLGSTAYSFSAGGQVSHPLVPLMNLTPICPHLPKIPPMTLSVNSRVTITPLETEKRPVRMVVDGETYRDDFKRIEVYRHSKKLQIAYMHGMDFTQRLVNKIIERS